MPFPFRNPVMPDDSDDSNDNQPSTDPKLEAIVQKMIDAGEPEENIASVIKSYKSQPIQTSTSTVKPTQGTGKGSLGALSTPPNPDDEWWKGAHEGFMNSMQEDMNSNPMINWGKGALTGALNTVGSMITHPVDTIRSIPSNLMHLPGQIEDAAMKSGTPEGKQNFQEMMGSVGGTPLLLEAAAEASPLIKPTLPSIGRGMQSVGDFIAKNQPVTGMAPPFAMPRTFRLLEKGVGKGTSLAGQGLEAVGNKLTDALNETKPDIPALQSKVNAIQDNIDKKYGPGNTSKASQSTQKTLTDTKQSIPLINRPGTFITIKNPTPDMIQQAQRLGYQFDSKTPNGDWRMKQTGKPMSVTSAPTNTNLSNIDLNSPFSVGGSY